jgi:ABC-type sugar transport system substrate-binding protein
MLRYLWVSVSAAVAFVIVSAASAQQAGVRMFVRLEVVQYSEWRKVYDGFAPARKAAGITESTLWQSADDPNDVTIVNEFPTLEQARAFAASGELKDAMHNSGLRGPPQVWFVSKVN